MKFRCPLKIIPLQATFSPSYCKKNALRVNPCLARLKRAGLETDLDVHEPTDHSATHTVRRLLADPGGLTEKPALIRTFN